MLYIPSIVYIVVEDLQLIENENSVKRRSHAHISGFVNFTMAHAEAMTWKHDDVIKWKHFPRYWPFVLGIHRSPMNSPHKSQWRGALMFSLIWVWINGWVNNREAGDLRRYRVHYDVTIMNAFRLTDPLWGESIGHRWIHLTKIQ